MAGQPLTASFHDVPASHGGKDSAFSFGLVFSEALVRQLSSATLRNEALSATNATVVRTKRVVKGDNRRWTVTVQPDSGAEVTVSLPATTDCAAAGALCTPGRAGAVERGDGDGIKCGNGDRVARGAIGDGGVGGLEPDLGKHLHAGRDDPHPGDV